MRILAFIVALICGATQIRAVSPTVGDIRPTGGQRGTEMEVLFQGDRLADAQEILFFTPGIQVLKLEATNAVVKARIKIASDCRIGEHAMRVRTASGVSDFRTFYVGQFPTVAEVEPNSEFSKPQKIPMNVTVTGVVDNEDVDYYLIEAKQGQRISVEVEGIRLGRTLFDSYVAIMDMGRFVLASSDDTALALQDPAASVVAPKDGTYVIQIRESSYGGNGACTYRMHVGNFPRPTGVFPAGGKAGETVSVKFLGDVSGEFTQQIKLPDAPHEKFGVFAERDGLFAPSPNWLRASAFPNVLEAEPNNDKEHATVVTQDLPIALNGVISEKGDADWFKVKAKAGQVYEVNVYARRIRSPLDSVLRIYNAQGGLLAENDDAVGADSYIRFTFPADGDYFIRVNDHLGKGGPDYFYRVELAAIQPTLALVIPDVSRNNTQERKAMVVPRGNRFASLVLAQRANFGGELVLAAENLPKGVTLQTANVAANLDQLPVVFEAAADAPLGGGMVDFTARHLDPAQKISGRLRQNFDLVYGEPNATVYYQTLVDKLPVAVAEEVPFKISIVEPKVPLVRDGSMSLKVVVERKPGFDEPINLKMLWGPPGVGYAPDVQIPKGQNSALYPLNANGGAEIRSWKIAILANATVNGAPAWVSSQLATLQIAEPFVLMKIEMASTEPGVPTKVVCVLDQKVPFEGKANVQLLGLPAGVVAANKEISKGDKEVVFDVTIDKTSPIGQHRSLFCSITIPKDGDVIPHSVGGGGLLRIDPPKPPKVEPKPVAAVAVAAAPPPPPPTAAPEKRLTRLEQLRLEQAEREKKARENSGK